MLEWSLELRELEATLTDAALSMFGAIVERANLRARKRLKETIAASADQGRERLILIAHALEAPVGGTWRKLAFSKTFVCKNAKADR